VIEHPIVFASGRVLLAFQSRATQLRYAAREDLARLSPNSPVTVEDMTALLDEIARQGFAITKNVLNSGIAAVAAPVFDANRQAILAIGCSAPISRSTDAQIGAVLSRLRETATSMSHKLGGSAPAPRQSSAA
jgi:DNA-binding IclR family transcriptional regulator